MTAIVFRKSIPRYLALRALGPRWEGAYTSALSLISLREVPPPRLPGALWAVVSPVLSGICGSDLATICCKQSAYLSPLTSTPFVLGHEVVGRIVEAGAAVRGFAEGQRVVIRPALGCAARGIDPPCERCVEGQYALCSNVDRGDLPAGVQTGYCAGTGGGWSGRMLAHQSQLVAVPADLSDTAAVLTEPLACAMHAVLRAAPADGATALVIGCGAIGLLTIAALHELCPAVRILVVAKYAHQREWATRLGAATVLPFDRDVARRYRAWADVLGARLFRPEIGKPTVVGGADVTFDCVASSTSIDDACRFTRSGGRMLLVGMPAIPRGIDWTAMWFKELDVRAAYAYGLETIGDRRVDTFALSLEMLVRRQSLLSGLVGTPFGLADYRRAIGTARSPGPSGSIKTVFRIVSA